MKIKSVLILLLNIITNILINYYDILLNNYNYLFKSEFFIFFDKDKKKLVYIINISVIFV